MGILNSVKSVVAWHHKMGPIQIIGEGHRRFWECPPSSCKSGSVSESASDEGGPVLMRVNAIHRQLTPQVRCHWPWSLQCQRQQNGLLGACRWCAPRSHPAGGCLPNARVSWQPTGVTVGSGAGGCPSVTDQMPRSSLIQSGFVTMRQVH